MKQIKLNIPIGQSQTDVYLMYLKITNIFNPLTTREQELLAYIMYYNELYSNIDSELRKRILFDYDTKVEIREKMNISEANFNNLISNLKKKGVIVNDNLHKAYDVLFDDKSEMVLKFFKHDS
jgi:hypothetical protein